MSQPDEVRVFEVSTSGLSANSFRFRDLIDIADVTGLDVLDLSPILEGRQGSGTDRLKAIAAFTWVTYRRAEPGLTFEDVLNGRVKVTGNSEANPTLPDPQT